MWPTTRFLDWFSAICIWNNGHCLDWFQSACLATSRWGTFCWWCCQNWWFPLYQYGSSRLLDMALFGFQYQFHYGAIAIWSAIVDTHFNWCNCYFHWTASGRVGWFDILKIYTNIGRMAQVDRASVGRLNYYSSHNLIADMVCEENYLTFNGYSVSASVIEFLWLLVARLLLPKDLCPQEINYLCISMHDFCNCRVFIGYRRRAFKFKVMNRKYLWR